MTNSSWTQAHIQALLSKGKSSWLAGLLLMDDLTEKKRVERGETVVERTCEVVFPPCDTDGLVGFGLGKGGKRMVSLAQFRYVPHPFAALRGYPMTMSFAEDIG